MQLVQQSTALQVSTDHGPHSRASVRHAAVPAHSRCELTIPVGSNNSAIVRMEEEEGGGGMGLTCGGHHATARRGEGST